MGRAVRWGVLGAGRVARDFAEGLRALPDADLVAVASRTPATAEAFASELRPRRVHRTYEDVVRDDEVEVVYVATPHHLHVEHCLLSLDHGKPVLCEKPFAVDAAGARRVIARARQQRLFCMEAMWMRFMPVVQEARDIIQGGAIGDVLMLTADFGVPAPVDPHSRFFDPAMGGGALLDRGVYTVSLASMLLGSPATVASQATIGRTGVDEQVAVVLGYPNGQLALLSASLRTYSANEAVAMGTRGAVRLHPPFYRPYRLSVTTFTEPRLGTGTAGGWKQQLKQRARRSRLVLGLYERVKPLVRRGRTVTRRIEGNGYNYEAAEVMRCLRAGELESAVMPLDETLRIMETLDEARSQWRAAGAPAAPAAPCATPATQQGEPGGR
jgi:predicted dehydrogenase